MNAGQTISPMVSIESYISFVSTTLVTFGIVFELPVVVIMFTRIGLLNPAMLRKNRKYVILAVFVLAAFYYAAGCDITDTGSIPHAVFV